jgi:hypothetical protein
VPATNGGQTCVLTHTNKDLDLHKPNFLQQINIYTLKSKKKILMIVSIFSTNCRKLFSGVLQEVLPQLPERAVAQESRRQGSCLVQKL